MPLAAIGLGIGLVGAVGKMISGAKANKQLGQLIGQDPTYTASPIAGRRLALAQSLLNARMPGATYAQSNIYNAGANQEANVQRNATSGSQALAAGAATQAQENKGFLGLSNEEAQDYQRRYANTVGAQEGEIQEQTKAFQDQTRRFGDLAQIRGAQNANTQSAWQSVSNLGMGALNFGLSGGFNRLFQPKQQ
jgi:hypothetical protein